MPISLLRKSQRQALHSTKRAEKESLAQRLAEGEIKTHNYREATDCVEPYGSELVPTEMEGDRERIERQTQRLRGGWGWGEREREIQRQRDRERELELENFNTRG